MNPVAKEARLVELPAERMGSGRLGAAPPVSWTCPVCGAMAGAQDLDDELPCWDCQQDARETFLEEVRADIWNFR